MMRSISALPDYVESLSVEEQHRFRRLYDVITDEGSLSVPEEMEGWVEDSFGSVEAVTSQNIVRVVNRLTDEATLFNGLRADRPIDAAEDVDVDDVVAEHEDGPFSNPREETPADTFGRVEGETCVSASNIAKYDGRHGLIVADDPDPLNFSKEELRDRFDVASQWFEQAADSTHKYPFLMWNCLWKSGASIVHSHLQLLLGKKRPYHRVETLERAAKTYQETFGNELFEDMYRVHDDLGLSLSLKDVSSYAHLTPRKEKEVILTADSLTSNVVGSLHEVLRSLIDDLGVQSFNVAVYYNPLADEEWSLPVICRVVDRGSLDEKTTDMGGMEVYGGENVVSSDPFSVAETIRS